MPLKTRDKPQLMRPVNNATLATTKAAIAVGKAMLTIRRAARSTNHRAYYERANAPPVDRIKAN
jgi:hypothetical protein